MTMTYLESKLKNDSLPEIILDMKAMVHIHDEFKKTHPNWSGHSDEAWSSCVQEFIIRLEHVYAETKKSAYIPTQ